MATPIQFRRGTTVQRLGVTLDAGMPGFDTDLKRLFVGDGVTPGGIDIAPPVVSFKNKIINGKLDFWQRGTSFSYTNGNTNAFTYTADRYLAQAYSGPTGTGSNTITMTQQAFAAGQTVVPGNPTYFGRLQASVLGPVAPAGFIRIQQSIEDVRTSAGSTVTISMWLKADSARTIMIGATQNLGSGGSSPTYSGVLVNVTTTWARYNVTMVLPSLSGKTIGANSHLDIGAYLHCTDPGFPVQTPNNWSTAAYLDFCEMQCEEGPVATDFEQRPPAVEMALSQRYYERNADVGVALLDATAQTFTSFAFAANTVRMTHTFRVTKRVFPAITYARPGSSGAAAGASATQWAVFSANWAAATVATLTSGTNGFCANLTTTIAGGTSCLVEGNWAADAEF